MAELCALQGCNWGAGWDCGLIWGSTGQGSTSNLTWWRAASSSSWVSCWGLQFLLLAGGCFQPFATWPLPQAAHNIATSFKASRGDRVLSQEKEMLVMRERASLGCLPWPRASGNQGRDADNTSHLRFSSPIFLPFHPVLEEAGPAAQRTGNERTRSRSWNVKP